jgi:hypothetical protein
MRERIARVALASVQGHTWEAALRQLAAGYEVALGEPGRSGSTDHADRRVSHAPVA